MRVLIDIVEGTASLGSCTVAVATAGAAGELEIGGTGGTVVRPLTFGERWRAVVTGLASPRPIPTVGAAVRAAAVVREGTTDRLVEEVLALVLAGATDEGTGCSFTDAVIRVAQATGWGSAQLEEASASLVDQLAADLGKEAPDGGWTTFRLEAGTAPDPELDVAELRDTLALHLLERAAPSPSARDRIERTAERRPAARRSASHATVGRATVSVVEERRASHVQPTAPPEPARPAALAAAATAAETAATAAATAGNPPTTAGAATAAAAVLPASRREGGQRWSALPSRPAGADPSPRARDTEGLRTSPAAGPARAGPNPPPWPAQPADAANEVHTVPPPSPTVQLTPGLLPATHPASAYRSRSRLAAPPPGRATLLAPSLWHEPAATSPAWPAPSTDRPLAVLPAGAMLAAGDDRELSAVVADALAAALHDEADLRGVDR